jgi:hypothetical protein
MDEKIERPKSNSLGLQTIDVGDFISEMAALGRYLNGCRGDILNGR